MSSDFLGLPNKEDCRIVDFDLQFEKLHLLSTAHANCVYASLLERVGRSSSGSALCGDCCTSVGFKRPAGEGVSAHQTILRSFSGLLVLSLSCYAKEYCCDCGVADMSDQEEVVEEDEGGVGEGSGEKEEGGGGAEGFPQEQDLPAE